MGRSRRRRPPRSRRRRRRRRRSPRRRRKRRRRRPRRRRRSARRRRPRRCASRAASAARASTRARPKAGGKRAAAAQKKKGVGLFKPVTVSAALSAITGIKGKTTRGQVTKAVWVHIKKKGLNKGRNVGKIDGIFGGGSMFKLAGAISKHIK